MMDFFNMIHDSIGWKIVGIALIAWAFYTLLRHPDRVLIDSIMHKKVTEYEEEQRIEKVGFTVLESCMQTTQILRKCASL